MSSYDISHPPPMSDAEFHAMNDSLQKLSAQRFAEIQTKMLAGQIKKINESKSTHQVVKDIFAFLLANKSNVHNAIVLSAGIADAAVRGDAVSFFRGMIAVFSKSEMVTLREIETIMGKASGRQCYKFLQYADDVVGAGVNMLPAAAKSSVTEVAAILSNPGPWIAQYSLLANSESTISRLVGNELRDKILNALTNPTEEVVTQLGSTFVRVGRQRAIELMEERVPLLASSVGKGAGNAIAQNVASLIGETAVENISGELSVVVNGLQRFYTGFLQVDGIMTTAVDGVAEIVIAKTAASFGTSAASIASSLGSAVYANAGGIIGLATERVLIGQGVDAQTAQNVNLGISLSSGVGGIAYSGAKFLAQRAVAGVEAETIGEVGGEVGAEIGVEAGEVAGEVGAEIGVEAGEVAGEVGAEIGVEVGEVAGEVGAEIGSELGAVLGEEFALLAGESATTAVGAIAGEAGLAVAGELIAETGIAAAGSAVAGVAGAAGVAIASSATAAMATFAWLGPLSIAVGLCVAAVQIGLTMADAAAAKEKRDTRLGLFRQRLRDAKTIEEKIDLWENDPDPWLFFKTGNRAVFVSVVDVMHAKEGAVDMRAVAMKNVRHLNETIDARNKLYEAYSRVVLEEDTYEPIPHATILLYFNEYGDGSDATAMTRSEKFHAQYEHLCNDHYHTLLIKDQFVADHAVFLAGSQKRWNEREQEYLSQMVTEFRAVSNSLLGTRLSDPVTVRAMEDDNWKSFPTAIAAVCTTLCSIVYTDAAETGPFATFMHGETGAQLLDFEEITVENISTHVMARVYISQQIGAAFVVFRGTDFYHSTGVRINLMSDVQGDFAPFNTPMGQILVHGGFKRAFESIEQHLLDKVSRIQERYHGTISRIYITGHSLGGAMAALCSVSTSFNSYFSGLITIGQPRVFHKHAHGIVTSLIGERSWRLVNRGDAIVLANILPGYQFLLRARIFDDEGRSYADAIGDRDHFLPEVAAGKFSMDQHSRHIYMGGANNLYITRPLNIPLYEVREGFQKSPFGNYCRVCFSSAKADVDIFTDPDERELVKHYIAEFMEADRDNSGLLDREEFFAFFDKDGDGFMDEDTF